MSTYLVNAEQCINEMNEVIRNSEYRSVEVKGHSLTRSEVEEVIVYAESFNGYSFDGLSEPLGSVKGVLNAYGLKETYRPLF